MQNAPGTYALLLRASTARTITVGALGDLQVSPGSYVYVGSAFGPGGLRARAARHARGDGALHWHIDYLRSVTTLVGLWYTHDETRRECQWASLLHTSSPMPIPMANFGASDCSCSAHLAAFESPPSFADFCTQARHNVPDHAPIHRTSPSTILEG